jgi:O-glycosyl hydrolase
MRFRSGWWLVSASLVLAGCGGGGGGGGSSTPPPTAPTVTAVGPASGATGVAVTSAITATFSTAMNSSTLTSSTFTLTAPAGPVVAGTVTYNSTSDTATFTPGSSLAAGTTYTATITTGAQSSSGTALSANYAWSFTTAAGPAPTITAFTPGNEATNVSASTTVTATFSEAMNASTITASTFTLTGPGGTAVTGTVTYNSTSFTATFTPGAALAFNTAYTATLTTGVQSSAGAALAQASWSFTTGGPPAPTVTAETPGSSATGVAVTTTVTATFSEAMTASTLTTSTFTLTGPSGPVTGTTSYSSTNLTATFTPSGALSYGTAYTATLTNGITASDGVALAQFTWTFTTLAAPPTVTAVTPTSASTGVAVTTALTATFSQVMNSSTITSSTFTLATQGGTQVSGAVGYNSTTSVATFTPAQNLAYDTAYTATITTGATSSQGIALAQNYTWSFTTAAAPVPTVSSTVPASGATNVSASSAIAATFSQPMNAATLTASTFTLATTTGNTAVTGTVAYTAGTQTATFTPASALAYSTEYTATITTGATSTAGAALASNDSWSFTTGAAPAAVTVDFGTTYQTIQGFGGSTAWLGQMPSAVATALFSPTNGLGLSILRVRIDPTGSASGGGAEGLPYETGEWDYEAANGQEAYNANPNTVVFATPWTAPAAWKLNGTSTTVDGTAFNEAFYNGACSPVAPSGESYCGGYLDPNHYADYANYLEDFVTFFNSTDTFHLYAISMQNEPEENVSYESCVWTPQQMDTWVADNASTITSDAYSTKLIMPESDDFNPVDASAALSDTNAEGLISIIGGHIYQVLFGGSITAYPALPAGDSTKAYWMTEFGPLSSTAPSWSTAVSTYAEAIHNSMVTGQYNAFVWWGVFGESAGSCATAAGTCGLVDNAGNVSVTGDVVGQYSKFIQPGYVRASATASPTANVFVSAYTGSESGTQHYVIVAINANATAENLAFTVNDNGNPDASVTSLTPTESTSAGGLMPQTAVPVANGQFTFALPAQSIVTFVQ